jgi:hypothetical protein
MGQVGHMATDVIETKNLAIRCVHCNVTVRRRNIDRHQNTPACRASRRHKALISAGWQNLNHEIQRYSVNRSLCTRDIQGIHRCDALTHYSRGGWGRRGHHSSRTYLRASLIQLYNSPLITCDEFNECLKLKENDPIYQARLALVCLAGDKTR